MATVESIAPIIPTIPMSVQGYIGQFLDYKTLGAFARASHLHRKAANNWRQSRQYIDLLVRRDIRALSLQHDLETTDIAYKIYAAIFYANISTDMQEMYEYSVGKPVESWLVGESAEHLALNVNSLDLLQCSRYHNGRDDIFREPLCEIEDEDTRSAAIVLKHINALHRKGLVDEYKYIHIKDDMCNIIQRPLESGLVDEVLTPIVLSMNRHISHIFDYIGDIDGGIALGVLDVEGGDRLFNTKVYDKTIVGNIVQDYLRTGSFKSAGEHFKTLFQYGFGGDREFVFDEVIFEKMCGRSDHQTVIRELTLG